MEKKDEVRRALWIILIENRVAIQTAPGNTVRFDTFHLDIAEVQQDNVPPYTR